MTCLALQTGRHIDPLALGQSHDRALDVAGTPDNAPESTDLALADEGIDRRHLDLEQRLDVGLYLALGRGHGDVENDLVVLRRRGRFLGDDRAADDGVMIGRSHLNRSVSASTAALVRTSVSRRMMS